MAASSSSSADPNTNSNSYYDVFISHRGIDVKKTLASHLYHRLHSYGLKVFLDQEELQRGDYLNSQIRGAIRTASVHVTIFSVRYAESTWCLNELLWMLESNAPIIPVFYHVKPTDLRWTLGNDGVYAQALQKLAEKTTYDCQAHQRKQRHDSATIEQWRNALSHVSGISGFELEACNGDEGILLNEVIESVLRNVKKPLDVAKYPTGLDEKVADFENKVLLQHKRSGNKPHVAGIVGLGGVGKTTLAKRLFNIMSSQYSRCCFLSDVRETVDKGSLVSLQSSLLKRLSGSDLPINNKDEGIDMLKQLLPCHPTLLILDDVDKVDQLDALVPNQKSIHSNSLILVTSRDKSVLTRSGVEESSIYKMNGLNKQHSLKLFCRHAFSQPYPLPKFEVLTEKFVEACDGLPLSLKVFGALLYGNNDISYWKKRLDKLVKILPSEIQERLRISYNALDREEKQIFLDIACFLIGEKKDTAIRIWDSSNWEGNLGFQNLQNKCLVEVVEWHSDISSGVSVGMRLRKIHMHDHLRDLGRYVAASSSPCRLWRWTENLIDDLMLQSTNGHVIVRGIRMVLGECHGDDEFDSIQMRRLQLVDTEGSLAEPILRRVKSPNLIWLRWKRCPYSSLPSWIPLNNLKVLQVSNSALETLWQQESQLPVRLEELQIVDCMQLKSISGFPQLTKLQRLSVTGCVELELELPTIGTLVSLEELQIDACVKLKSIPGFAQWQNLRDLNVSNCFDLTELSMETLVSLEELRAYHCVKLQNLKGLELATKLRLLDVRMCFELEDLPSMETLVFLEELWADRCVKLKSIRGLELATKLLKLSINGCSKLEKLSSMEQASKLQLLDVGGCSELEELPSMETLVSLEELWAEGCVKQKTIRGLKFAVKLKKLNVNGCSELQELPSMETLASLKELWADGCVKLKSIKGLELATKLEKLSVNGCSELEELPRMETFVSLKGLWADGCVKLKSIRGLEQATQLRLLNVSGCSQLEELPSIETLVWLEELLTEGCVKLKSIRGLGHCTRLKRLVVFGCSELKELPSMETLVSLEMLWAGGCVKLKSIRGLAQCTMLRKLIVSGCSELEELPSMKTLVSLESLLADKCVKLKSLRGLEGLTKLRHLRFSACCKLEELSSMETLVSLEELTAVCVKVKKIRGLEFATKLQRLNVNRCSELEELPSIETLVSLEVLWAEGCVKLKRIRGLQFATMLRSLSVNGCCELEELPTMETLVSLEYLRADGCVKLKSIQGLAQCTNLRGLDVSGCSELEELPSLATLESLYGFWADGCVKLKRIRGLFHCTQLQMLSVRGCCELEELEGVEHCTWLENLDVSRCSKLLCPVWE